MLFESIQTPLHQWKSKQWISFSIYSVLVTLILSVFCSKILSSIMAWHWKTTCTRKSAESQRNQNLRDFDVCIKYITHCCEHCPTTGVKVYNREETIPLYSPWFAFSVLITDEDNRNTPIAHTSPYKQPCLSLSRTLRPTNTRIQKNNPSSSKEGLHQDVFYIIRIHRIQQMR